MRRWMGQVLGGGWKGRTWSFEEVQAYARTRPAQTFLIDVREGEEVRSTGLIPNSHHIPLGELEAALLDPARYAAAPAPPHRDASLFVFSCAHGTRAAQAARTAQTALGCPHVAVYPGSFSEWQRRTQRAE